MLILAMLVLLAGCAAAPASPAVQCRIVLESSPAFTAQTQTAAVTPGQSVNFTLTPADGYTLTGADYPGASLTRTGAAYILTLPDVRYSVAVAVTAEKSDTVLYYNDNYGGGWVTVPVTASHLRLNTAIDDALFTRPGYTLTGWNTAPDGSGQAVGLGSRTEPGARLYAQWTAQNDAAEFTYTVENDAAAITGWQGGGEVLVIPDTLGGAPVVEIAAGAFADAPCKTVIFPDTLRRVQPGAFSGSAAESVTLFDNLQQISDYAFEYGQNITSVTVPSSVTTIGDYAFYLCNGIRTVNLPAGGLTRIGASAFDSCSGITSIAIPNSVSYIGTFAFAWAPIESANIYQGVIESHAFEGCGCISNVTIGSGVTYIGDNAFNRCAGLRTVQYGGSRAQWRALEIGANNEALTGASVTCSGSGSASTDGVDRTKIHVGGTVKYGSYEQDNNASNGAETIEWTVLDIQGDKALVISKKVLDFQRYYPNLQTTVTWANSSIRTWLNDSFYNAAFSDGQKSGIYTTSVSGESNTVFGTSGGSATGDKIFLLSASEAANYLNTDGKRMANCTEYALSRNGDPALRNTNTQSSYWWLRTPGIYTYDAMYVHYTGSLRYDGMAVANVIGGVRPAMWLNKNVVEVVPESNRVITKDPIEQFVTRLYQVCLNREPDDAGLNDWVNRLSSGQASGVEVSYGFVFSQEFQNYNYCNTDYVKQLYRAFMGREYDQGGLDDWVGRLETGTTREEVFNGFSQSEEFNNLCTQYGITRGDGIAVPQYGTVPRGACTVCGATDGVTAFVTRLYNICLDRNPDTDGLNDWTNGLWDHTKSGGSVAQGFIFSQEFKNKNLNDNDYVEYLYRAFFDRSADAGGKADWVSRMQTQGYSREDVFNGFVGSEEFNNLCKKYGITRD